MAVVPQTSYQTFTQETPGKNKYDVVQPLTAPPLLVFGHLRLRGKHMDLHARCFMRNTDELRIFLVFNMYSIQGRGKNID